MRPAAPVHEVKAQRREDRGSITPGAAEKQAQRKPQASSSQKPSKVTPATATAKPAAENKKIEVTDPVIASLLKVLNSCPAVAEDDECLRAKPGSSFVRGRQVLSHMPR